MLKELLYWSDQALSYLSLKRLSVGLNEEEHRLLEGLQGAADQAKREVGH